MKHLSIKLLVTVAAIVLSTNLSATNPIENLNTTTFVEIEAMNTSIVASNLVENVLEISFLSLEERKIKVIIEDQRPNETASGIIKFVSSNGIDELGPYTVTEGVTLEVTVGEGTWVLQEIEKTDGAIITHWFL